MALVRPQDAIFAVVENTGTWGPTDPAIAVAALSALEPNPPGILIPPNQQYVEDTALTGLAGRLPFAVGNHEPDWSGDFNMRYDGALWLLFALFYGDETYTLLENTGTDPIGGQHDFVIAPNLDDVEGTFAIEMINAIIELDFFKVDQIVITGTSGGIITAAISGMGRRWANDSAINDTAALQAVTLEGPRHNMLFDAITLRINDQSDIALAAADEICIESFTMTLTRGLAGKVTSCDAPYRDQLIVPAPGYTGTLAFEIPRWETTALQDAHLAGVVQKADLICTGPLIPDGDVGQDEELTLLFPALTLTGWEWSESETYGESITAEIGRADALPTGFTELNHTLQIDNERQSAYTT